MFAFVVQSRHSTILPPIPQYFDKYIRYIANSWNTCILKELIAKVASVHFIRYSDKI